MYPTLETKFAPLTLTDPAPAGKVQGYAALFDTPDRGGDVIARGAFAASLARAPSVKLLWQHDPAQPIGVWDAVAEDARGLKVAGRLIAGVRRGREASALLAAGALDGLSIGYRAVRAERRGGHRHLLEIELWEISLVTFPMMPGARLAPPPAPDAEIAEALSEAARAFR